MNQPGTTFNHIVRLPQKPELFVLATFGALSSTVLLKVAAIQYLELLEIVLALYVLFRILRCNFRFELSLSLCRLLLGYSVLLLLIVAGCMFAFTRPFYLEVNNINGPGFVSIARVVELLLAVSATVVLTEVFRRSRTKCLFTAKIYFGIGTLSALFSLVGFALRGPFAFFVKGGRASGFYNEGGPYGLYVLSVILVGITLTRLSERLRPRFLKSGILIDILGLILSASKAAYIAVALLLVIQVLYAGGLRQKFISFTITVASLIAIFSFTPASRGITGYIEGGRRFEAISQVRPDDVNFSYGRVAAIFFVPRMVEHHPWLGVGFGNYGLVRNAPEYRGNAAVAAFLDHDGLGLFGLTAEIGLPAMALLIYLLLQPALISRRLTHAKSILALAFIQPVAHFCGAQLNLTYPWVASALSVGMAMIPESDLQLEPFSSKKVIEI